MNITEEEISLCGKAALKAVAGVNEVLKLNKIYITKLAYNPVDNECEINIQFNIKDKIRT